MDVQRAAWLLSTRPRVPVLVEAPVAAPPLLAGSSSTPPAHVSVLAGEEQRTRLSTESPSPPCDIYTESAPRPCRPHVPPSAPISTSAIAAAQRFFTVCARCCSLNKLKMARLTPHVVTPLGGRVGVTVSKGLRKLVQEHYGRLGSDKTERTACSRFLSSREQRAQAQ